MGWHTRSTPQRHLVGKWKAQIPYHIVSSYIRNLGILWNQVGWISRRHTPPGWQHRCSAIRVLWWRIKTGSHSFKRRFHMVRGTEVNVLAAMKALAVRSENIMVARYALHAPGTRGTNLIILRSDQGSSWHLWLQNQVHQNRLCRDGRLCRRDIARRTRSRYRGWRDSIGFDKRPESKDEPRGDD